MREISWPTEELLSLQVWPCCRLVSPVSSCNCLCSTSNWTSTASVRIQRPHIVRCGRQDNVKNGLTEVWCEGLHRSCCDLFQPILPSWHTSTDRLEFYSCAISSSLLPRLSRLSVWKEKQGCLKERRADGMMIKQIDKGKFSTAV